MVNQNKQSSASEEKVCKSKPKCNSLFSELYKKVHNLFFPSKIKCIICGDDLPEVREIEVCDNCLQRLVFIDESHCCGSCGAPLYGEAKYCFNCKDNVREFDAGRSVFVYEGEVEKLISGLKFGNKPYFARTLGRFLAQLYAELGWKVDLVIPVPSTQSRKKERGYNQAELLVEEFCQETKLPFSTETLIKYKETEEQKELTMLERQKNIQDAFRVQNKYAVQGHNILVIDDVMTTGATASACAGALKKAHAKNVYVLCVAHGRPKIASQENLEDIKSVINSVK